MNLTESTLALSWLIPALPLLATLAIALTELLRSPRPVTSVLDLDEAERFPSSLAVGANGLALLGLIAVAVAWFQTGARTQHLILGEWLRIQGSEHQTALTLSLLIDPLALGFGTLAAFFGLLTQLFSLRYMHREPGFARYFAALSLFVGSMLLIALAGSAWLTFVGWELAGLASWLLIGYARERPAATGAALFGLLTNRIGDAGFLLGIGFAAAWLGSTEWPTLIMRASVLDTVSMSLLTLVFLGAALVKSGQWPFSVWLARALEGPTPSSAIFYGCLTLHVGVFLVLRLEPLIRLSTELMWLLLLTGLVTTATAWWVGLSRSDIKSSLLFGALAQVGLMFAACGMGWFTWAAFHLVAHATFRLWQFLSAPSWLLAPDAVPTPPRLLNWLPQRWLARLHASARNGLGVDFAANHLLVWPTQRLGRDMQTIDHRIIEPALGQPAAEPGAPAPRYSVPMQSIEMAGALLARFEALLLVQKQGGRMAQLLSLFGQLLSQIENLLEEPRYLFLFIMATLVVIL